MPDHPAQGGGLADRPAGVRAEGQRHEAGGHRGRRLPPRRAAGHPAEVVGVAGRPERRVLGRGAHGELVQVGLADHHRPGRGAGARPRWRRRGGASLEDARRAGGRDPAGCTGCPSGPPAPRPAGRGRARPPPWRRRRSASAAGRLVEHGQEGRDRPVAGGDRGPGAPSTTRAGRTALPGRAPRAARAAAPDGPLTGLPRIRGHPEAVVLHGGAWASTSSRSRHGAISSSRSTLTSGSGWAVGGTADRSSAATSAACSSTAASCPVKRSSSSSVEGEPGQAGHVGDLLASERPCRGATVRRAHSPSPSTERTKPTVRASISSRS